MRFLYQRRWGFGCELLVAAALVGFGSVSAGAVVPAASWDVAVQARARFEAAPAGTHTKAEYARVMDGFRAIYHAEPGAAHAARAVEQVAELLVEQGRELNDRKSLHDAAGQYEFLAKAYPGGERAEHALVTAVELLGPDAADDPVELKKVKAELVVAYPRAARELAASSAPTSQKRDVGHPPSIVAATNAGISPLRPRDAAASGRDDTAVASAKIAKPATVVREAPAAATLVPAVAEKAAGPAAMVTGIRHWSTASYTRVAIDLDV